MNGKVNSINLKTIALNIIVAATAFLLIISHRVSCILNPQFWAEDVSWYAGAYLDGKITTLFQVIHGYYDLIPRLVGAVAQLFPFHDGPLVFNVMAIAGEILIVLLLISKRFVHVAPNLAIRVLLGFIIIAVPHVSEIHANITGVQWYFAILLFLIIVAAPANTWWKIFDVVTLILAGLTGPFSLFLFPVAIIYSVVRKNKWTIVLTSILAVTAIFQSLNVLSSPRIAHSSSYSIDHLLSIIGGQFLFSAIFGKIGYKLIYDYRLPFVIASTLVGMAITLYTLVTARLELKLFILYTVLVLAPTLILAEWDKSNPYLSDRFCLLPITCFLFSLVYCAFAAKLLPFKILGIMLLLLAAIGICGDWIYPPLKDRKFQEHAREFENSPSGTKMTFQVNPDGWDLTLIKKDDKWFQFSAHPILNDMDNQYWRFADFVRENITQSAGEDCFYEDYKGTVTILSVDNSPNSPDSLAVGYLFEAEDVDAPAQIKQIWGSMSLPKQIAELKDVKVNKKFQTKASYLKKGNCTPSEVDNFYHWQ